VLLTRAARRCVDGACYVHSISALTRALLLGTLFTPISWFAQTAHAQDPSIASITVTARRRVEKLQNVPLPISVISGAELRRHGTDQMQQLQFSVPWRRESAQSFAYYGPNYNKGLSPAVAAFDNAYTQTVADPTYIQCRRFWPGYLSRHAQARSHRGFARDL
jgi:hypothetical protein